MVATLRRFGFEPIGLFRRAPGGRLEVSAPEPDRPGLYGLVKGTTVLYVGSAINSVKGRMRGYCSPIGRRRRSQAKINLHDAVDKNERVRLFYRPPAHRRVCDLRIPVCIDFECCLILELKPAWNVNGLGKRRLERMLELAG